MIIKARRLISSTTKEELEKCPWVTRDKSYIVLCLKFNLNQGMLAAVISDHYSQPIFIELDGFEIISQKIPKNWGIKIVNDFSYYVMPKNWMKDDFLESLENEEPQAVELFKKEAKIIYQQEGWLWKSPESPVSSP